MVDQENSALQPQYDPPAGQYYAQPSYNQQAAPAPTLPVDPSTSIIVKTEDYKAQLQDVAKNAKDVWDSVNGLKDIPGSVKVYAIIFHILKRSRFNFPEDPPLSMIIDGLSSNKDMRKVRNINGLLCKACSVGMPGITTKTEKKHYSFPQLVSHFASTHERGGSQNKSVQDLDWTRDMVELPDLSRLAATVSSIGKTDSRLKLIADALPEIFAPPQKTVDPGIQQVNNGGWESADPYDLPPGQDNHDKYYSVAASRKPSEPLYAAYDDGQYDPRNPCDLREQQDENHRQKHRALPPSQDQYRPVEDRPGRSYVEPATLAPAPQQRHNDGYGRTIIREEAPIYMERPRYRDDGDSQYRVRRDPAVVYDERDLDLPVREYRMVNSQAYRPNRDEILSPIGQQAPPRDIRYLPAEEVTNQQNRLSDVVAQISQQAKQARERPSFKQEQLDGGSKDGELHLASNSKDDTSRRRHSIEAANAAEQFLDNFSRIGETTRKFNNPELQEARVMRWEDERRNGSLQRVGLPSNEPLRRVRDGYEQDERVVITRGRTMEDDTSNGYVVREETLPPRQLRTYAYGDRHINSTPEQAVARERSPALFERRFQRESVVYNDERQGSSGMRRTPSKYARYENVRLENDRARSRSPVYVKMTAPTQYRERTPDQYQHREPVYHSRTPTNYPQEVTYERAPRQEYRIYADEPRLRQPVEMFEYVRIVRQLLI
jgi:hypothetical protein